MSRETEGDGGAEGATEHIPETVRQRAEGVATLRGCHWDEPSYVSRRFAGMFLGTADGSITIWLQLIFYEDAGYWKSSKTPTVPVVGTAVQGAGREWAIVGHTISEQLWINNDGARAGEQYRRIQ